MRIACPGPGPRGNGGPVNSAAARQWASDNAALGAQDATCRRWRVPDPSVEPKGSTDDGDQVIEPESTDARQLATPLAAPRATALDSYELALGLGTCIACQTADVA